MAISEARDNLKAVMVVEKEKHWGTLTQKIIYRIQCERCGTVFSHFNYDYKTTYYCEECRKIIAKEKAEKIKAEKKETERKILKKFKQSVEQTKKTMCNGFCIIPRAFTDEAVKQEACTNCPFLRIEVWDD